MCPSISHFKLALNNRQITLKIAQHIVAIKIAALLAEVNSIHRHRTGIYKDALPTFVS
jgi:hypothetical protein